MAVTPYRGLPPLGGLCSMEDAMREGVSVEECVRRLKCFHYAFKRLQGIFTSRITSEPIYELKMAFSYHAYLCSEHVSALRVRVAEVREPPLGLEQVPHAGLEAFFDEILAAPGDQPPGNGPVWQGHPRVARGDAAVYRGYQPAGGFSYRPPVPLRTAGAGRYG